MDLKGRKGLGCRENYRTKNFLIFTVRLISYCSCDEIRTGDGYGSVSVFGAPNRSTSMTVFLQGMVYR